MNRPYGTNGLNQLTSAGATALGYDARGNLTSSGSISYGYTVESRLKSVSGAMTAYYDTLGRLAEYDTAVSTRFLYDNDRVTAELDNQGAVNPIKRRYIWGAGADELVAWYEGAGSGARRFVVQDERASIIAVSDSAGALIGINRYDEYGIPAATNIGRFQYTGQAFLAEAGLHHYKARAYSPTLGRFMQTDPIGYRDGINWYDYVDGDPVNRSDPSGTEGFFDSIRQGVSELPSLPGRIASDLANLASDFANSPLDTTLNVLSGLPPTLGGGLTGSLATATTRASVTAGEVAASRAAAAELKGATSITSRTTKAGERAIKVESAGGKVKDISPSRVKEFKPVTDTRAPPGTMQRVKFGNSQPGSKGFKRDPTPAEQKMLDKSK